MKLSWASCSTIVCRRYSSSTSGRKTTGANHYDNLEIKSDATHNEIKSAYFKLSKQYHPDMNNSPDAKLKFNHIAEAYEVLGNHGKRKQYDRGLRISPITYDGSNVTTKETEFGDFHEEAKRVKSEIFRNRTQGDGTPIYNFDAWTEAHYGKLFERRQKEISRAKYYEDIRAEKKKDEMSMQRDMPIFIILVLFAFMMLSINLRIADLDTPSVTLGDQEKTQNNNDVKKSRN